MAQYIRIDVFPARVTVSDGQLFDKCRAYVTEDTLYVYVDSASGPTIAYEARLDDFSGSENTGWTALTDTGDTVIIAKTSGCGCGSRLRGFNAFRGVQRLPS